MTEEISVLFGKITTAVGSRKYLFPCDFSEKTPRCQFFDKFCFRIIKTVFHDHLFIFFYQIYTACLASS